MITTHATYAGNGYLNLDICTPRSGKFVHEYLTVKEEEAVRLVYFKNRRYICRKIYSFLLQRRYAYRAYAHLPIYDAKLVLIESLIAKIDLLQNTSFFHVCKVITAQADNIQSLKPHKDSRLLHNYETVIKPIIQFCCKAATEIQDK